MSRKQHARIYLIGGASRSGKSTLTQLIAAKYTISWIPLDSLRRGLSRGAPHLSISPDNNDQQDAVRLWSILDGTIRSLLNDGRVYMIEGVALRPIDVARAIRKYKGRVAGCFLGYPDLDLDIKRRHVKKHRGGPNDWLGNHDDDYIATHLKYCRARSKQFEKSCAKNGIAFFDTGEKFKSRLNEAMRYLRSQ